MIQIDLSKEETVLVARVSGHIDTLTATEFQTTLLAAIDQGETHILIDMSDVDYVSSAGLRVFLILQKRLKPSGTGLELKGVSKDVKEVFDITGFTGLFLFSE